MVIYRCRECNAPVSRPVAELTDETLLRNENDSPSRTQFGGAGEPDYVPEGFYLPCAEESPIPETDGWPVLNPEDIVETELDMDVYCGCCGPDGSQGPNTDCRNGHKIGIERGDCWTVHCVALDPEAVLGTEAEETVTKGLDGRTLKTWIEVAESGSISDRRRAIVLLGIYQIDGPITRTGALTVLTDIAVNGPKSLRESALRALYRTPDEDAFPALQETLHDPDPTIRQLAAQALDEIDSDSVVEVLFDRLVEEREPSVCAEIKRSIGDDVTIDQLQKRFQGASTEAGQRAIVWLFRLIRQRETVQPIMSVIFDPDFESEVRKEALWSLLAFGPDRSSSSTLSADELTRLLLDTAETVEQSEVKTECLRKLAYREVTDPKLSSRRDQLFEALLDDSTVDQDMESVVRSYLEQD